MEIKVQYFHDKDNYNGVNQMMNECDVVLRILSDVVEPHGRNKVVDMTSWVEARAKIAGDSGIVGIAVPEGGGLLDVSYIIDTISRSNLIHIIITKACIDSKQEYHKIADVHLIP